MATFIPDHAGLAEIVVGPEITEALQSITEKAKGIAEGLSADFADTGDYESSFVTEVAIQGLPAAGSSQAHLAAVGTLLNTSGHAVAVEYGFEGRSDRPTKKAHRVLGRTLAALET